MRKELKIKENELIVFSTPLELSNELAETLSYTIRNLLSTQEFVTILLSGGSTPELLYRNLADNADIDWNSIHLFWSDERFVPHDSEESNYFLVKKTLIDSIPIPHENIHSIRTDFATKEEAATQYERDFQSFFGPIFPHFDINILGIGEDGHTASLFPGDPALHETKKMVVGVDRKKPPKEGITLTFPVLNNSEFMYVLATGEKKAEALKRILESSDSINDCPAKGISPTSGNLEWWIDEAAAKKISQKD